MKTNAHGGFQAYTHEVRGHTFEIRFDPPLLQNVDKRTPPVTYSMSLDPFADLVTGQIHTRHDSTRVVLEWRPPRPPWAHGVPFTSVLLLDEDGYQLDVSPLS